MSYEHQRWYDPTLGRFISQDPFAGHLSRPQTLNPYVYVDDSPTSSTDPTGMDGGFGADNRCEKLHQCSSAGPDPLLTGVSNWWNGLSPQQQATVALMGIGALIIGTAVADVFTGGAISEAFLPEGGAFAGELDIALSDDASTVAVTTTTTSGVTDLATGALTKGATDDLVVDTSAFFARAEVDAGAINTNTLVGLGNGFPVPYSQAWRLGQEWVGGTGAVLPSGSGFRLAVDATLDSGDSVLVQARFDNGLVFGYGPHVPRMVLEVLQGADRLIGLHLPLVD